MSLDHYTDEQILGALQYMASIHSDIVESEESLMHYKTEVLRADDFEVGYQEFARVREGLAMTVYEQQDARREAERLAARTPREVQQEAAHEAAERSMASVAEHLTQRSKGVTR